jgi:hypothetical protein
MTKDEPRYYAGQDRDLRWRVLDHLRPGSIAVALGVVVPGILTEAEATTYAKRINKIWEARR